MAALPELAMAWPAHMTADPLHEIEAMTATASDVSASRRGSAGAENDRGEGSESVRGESHRLFSPSPSLSNSTSQRRLAAFPVLLAGGEDMDGGESAGIGARGDG